MVYTLDEIRRRVQPVAEKYHLKAVYVFWLICQRGTPVRTAMWTCWVDLAGAELSGFLCDWRAL